ncbi:MAG: family 20 glycosylhydrolase [Planctomycetota bacterium]|jgi:hypothetical protein
MLKSKRVFAVLIITGFGFSSFADELPQQFKIIPKPREVKLLNVKGLEVCQLNAVELKDRAYRPLMGRRLSGLMETEKDEKGVLTLKLVRNLKGVDSLEGYVLTVQKGKAEIKAEGQSGLFYGSQTLEQLLEDAYNGGIEVPACEIVDYPVLSYRAIHIDVKHHLDRMKYYYDAVDRLARHKINAIIFEFEDKLQYRRQPLVGSPQAISIDEVAALTNYAKQRYIEITPLVQGLGHARFILKHNEYAYLREDINDSWVFCPLHEGTYQVLFDMYRDAIEATPGSRYLHIGGDEIGDIGECPRCKPMAEEEGIFNLNLYWLKRVCEFVKQQGRTPIFWDDMPLKHAGLWRSVRYEEMSEEEATKAWEKGEPILDSMAAEYPKDCVYMRWTYNMARQPGNVRALQWYRKHGLKAMIATAAQNVSFLLPRDDRVNVIHSFIGLAAERGIDGMLCTAWDDRSPHMETYWRGLIASAEFSWSPKGRTPEEYDKAFVHRWFGPECIKFDDLYARLYKSTEFWYKGFIAEGYRGYKDEKIMSAVPDLDSPGGWSEKYKEKLSEAKIEVYRYKENSELLAELKKKARRNHYHIEVLSVTNDFQITDAKILLALADCDTSDKAKQKRGMKKVRATLEEFDDAWEKLTKVYSETRFIDCPPGYVHDIYRDPYRIGRWEKLAWAKRVEDEYIKVICNWLEANGCE